ncbi:prosaposin-like [Scyliorhinus canicula]|uniref:prosaposin-like n=1 Tax=Scyliorhinus canicula TaxID=7830 RepID=UPI0018F5F646|nr:prosaposin-like [Scyliorhinus canicula]
MALFLFLALLFASPVRANLEERSKVCAHDVENQCRDLKAAVECNVVSHCVNTEWGKPKVDDDICDVCKKFIGQIADMLKDKTVQDALKEALHKGCTMIPVKQLADDCNHYVDTYLPIILGLLEKEVQPDVVCAALGLCKHRSQIRALETLFDAIPTLKDFPLNNTSWKQYQGPLRKGRFTCDFCLLVVKKLKQSLPKERTESHITQQPAKICSGLSNKYFTQCHGLMKEKGIAAIELLSKQFTANAVCDNLRLCSGAERNSVLPIMSCDTCEGIMLQLQTARKRGYEVDVLLSKACNSYSDVSNLMCEDFIQSNKPQLNNLLQHQEQRDLCGELDLCVRKETGQMLGLDECLWGPSYWCATRETAVRCQTIDYCEKHGWI